MRGAPRRFTDETGQAIVIVVVVMTILLGVAGLVIDVGRWYVQDRKAQAAADFGALAAAAKLPGNPGAATSAGKTYVGKNLAGATADVASGFGGDPQKVEVKVQSPAPTYFARIFGVDSVTVSARAVAERVPGGFPLAIFVFDSDCTSIGFKYNGNGTHISGGVHSNGSFSMNGNDSSVTGASAGGPNDCQPNVNGHDLDLGGGATMPEIDPQLHDWPAYFTTGDFACTYTAQKFTFNGGGQVIPPGVYCATEAFEANGNNQTGTITVLAPEITLNGNNQTFTPFSKGVLLFATGTKEMHVNGYSLEWSGILFHPNGRIKLNGDALSIYNGLVEGMTVEVDGNGFQMTGSGEASSESIALVE